MSLVLCVVVALAGWAMEVAHPVFFAREPLVLWTRDVETAPILFFCGEPWPVNWRQVEEDGKVRWEADLRDAPLGIWTVCAESECFSFLRVEDGASFVEIKGAPPGARVFLDQGEAYVVPANGRSFFLTQPGFHILTVEFLCSRLAQSLHARGGERTVVHVGELLDVRSSTPEVLPGHRFSIYLRVRSALALPYLQLEINGPPGWRVFAEELFLPVSAGALIECSFRVEVPPDAVPGEYFLALRWHGQHQTVAVKVTQSLSPLVVVGHWDVAEGDLALASPFALSFERVLWAVSLLGQPIPYTTELMTPELLRRILELWASGEAG